MLELPWKNIEKEVTMLREESNLEYIYYMTPENPLFAYFPWQLTHQRILLCLRQYGMHGQSGSSIFEKLSGGYLLRASVDSRR